MRKHKIYKVQDINNNSMRPGDHNRSPDESFNKTLIFIDDGFLAKLSKYFGKGKYLKFDRINLAKNLAKKENLFCEQIFYYLAPPFQSGFPTSEETLKKEGYDKFVRKLKERKVIIREGRCQRLKIDNVFKYKQKAVDVFLAMDLTNVSIKFPAVKKIIIIASDSDFVPVIKNLEENGVKTILYTYYDKKRNTNFSRSNELIKCVYKYILLTKQDFDNALLIKEKLK